MKKQVEQQIKEIMEKAKSVKKETSISQSRPDFLSSTIKTKEQAEFLRKQLR